MIYRLLQSRFAGFAYLLALLLLGIWLMTAGGCAPDKPPAPTPAATVLSAGTDAGAAAANVRSAKAATTQAATHADDVGKALLSGAVPILNDAEKGIGSLVQQYAQTLKDAAARDATNAKAIADEKDRTKAAIDAGNSAELKSLRGIEVLNIFLCILGIGGMIYCKSAVPLLGFMAPLAKALAGMGAAGAAIASAFCFVVQFRQAITPSLVRQMQWFNGGILCLIFAAVVVELIVHRKTIFETAKDTAASVQPSVPFPPAVANLLAKVAPNTPPTVQP